MKGVITYFIKHEISGNILLFVLVLFGLISLNNMRSSFFPETPSRAIKIQAVYPGASPEEVEEGIVLKIEDELRGTTGVERVTSVSRENSGTVDVEVRRGSNTDLVLQDVKNAVDRISSFPVGMEPLVVYKVEAITLAMSVALHGQVPLGVLKAKAREMERDLLAIEGISKVTLGGFPEEEITVNLSEEALRAYELSFAQVMERVRASNLQVTGGTVKGEEEELLIRYNAKGYYADELRAIVLKAAPDGRLVRLSDVAEVRDSWAEIPQRSEYNGIPSVTVDVYNTNTEDILFITDTVRQYVQTFNLRNSELQAAVIQDSSVTLRQRIETLQTNGIQGIVLVLVLLAFFLHLRLAFWVALAIPISFAGMFILAGFFGVTINVISLFGMIIVIGILVDDGIIISENIYRHYEMGKPRIRASIDGTMEVLGSVTSAILTTMVAFSSFFFIEGRLGDFFSEMAFIVIATLLFSLIEGFLVLPAHVAHSKALDRSHRTNALLAATNRFMLWQRDRLYAPVLEFFLRNKALGMAIPVALLVASLGLVKGGFVKTTFFPYIERDEISINLAMPSGTRESITKGWLDHLELSVWAANEQLKAAREDGKDVVLAVDKRLGGAGGHTGSLSVRLLDTEQRQQSVLEVTEAIRRATGPVPEAEQLTFGSYSAFGKPVAIGLRGPNLDELRAATEELKAELNNLTELKDVTDNDQTGQREVHLKLRDQAYLLGFTPQDILAQVRQGFFGGEVQRIQRGLDEVKVWVRYDERNRTYLEQLADMRIRTPDGRSYPLAELADFSLERGALSIYHTDGQREILIEADVASSKTSVIDLIGAIEQDILPPVLARHPSVRYGLEGQVREQAKSARSMQTVMPVVLILMLTLIMLTFRSFLQTLAVLLLLPFSYMGVIWGHYLHDKPISFFSVLGIIALVGIMVNDALVFVGAYNNNLQDGRGFRKALFEAGLSRFRPIILTSVTTIAGLAPLILNKSFQAQFLIPMAVSVAYGLIVATTLNLILLPVLLAVFNDLQRFAIWFWNDRKVSPESVEPAIQELAWQPSEAPVPVEGARGVDSGVVGSLLLFLGLGLLGGGGAVLAQAPADTLSLDQALAEAMQQNPALQRIALSREAAANLAHPGVAGLLPELSAGAGYTYGLNSATLEFADASIPPIDQTGAASELTTAQLSLQYTLQGLSPFRELDRLQAQAELAGVELEAALEETAVQVVAAYFGQVRAAQNLEAVQDLVQISAERYERAALRDALGSGSGLAVLQARVALNSDSAMLLDAQLALEDAQRTLNLVMGRPPGGSALVSRQVLLNADMDETALRQGMTSNNSTLKAAALAGKVSLLDWQVARSGFWPLLSLQAGYGYTLSVQEAGFIRSNRNLGFTAGAQLSIPLYTGGTRRIAAQNAELAYRSRLLEEEDLRRQMEAAFEQAWSSYRNALRLVQLQDAAVRTASDNLNRSRERLESGTLDATAFREAQLQYLEARNGWNNARFNAKLAEVEVLRLAGAL
jgi:multidrug efflux pump subunit AcrB/outer membrane protein TolC